MSLPPELRVLCFQLSSTAVSDLPRLTPTLLNYVLCCQAPMSMPAVAAGKAEASVSAVLVHKLKTQLSTLLNGKNAEGRFTAVILIKAVIEAGGWEVLNGSESWVRGLLSVLGVCECQQCSFQVISNFNPEARSCCYKGISCSNTHQDLLHDPSISNTRPRDHDANTAGLCICLSDFSITQIIN